MENKFFKYQSLGNDFILFDCLEKLNPFALSLSKGFFERDSCKIKQLCNRHTGIGADGVLIVTQNTELNIPEIFIYNADGSDGGVCFNGLRCVAHYLFTHKSFEKQFDVLMGGKKVACLIESFCDDAVRGNPSTGSGRTDCLSQELFKSIEIKPEVFSSKNPNSSETPFALSLSKGFFERKHLITTKIPTGTYLGTHKIKTPAGNFDGHIVDVGNPHYVIFEKQNIDWLSENGILIESHKDFPNKTNVEFVSETSKNNFDVIVFERGCGITQACSSGAAAITSLLFKLKKISKNEEIKIKMPGGVVTTWHDGRNVYLKAGASLVFKGEL